MTIKRKHDAIVDCCKIKNDTSITIDALRIVIGAYDGYDTSCVSINKVYENLLECYFGLVRPDTAKEDMKLWFVGTDTHTLISICEWLINRLKITPRYEYMGVDKETGWVLIKDVDTGIVRSYFKWEW